MITAAILGGVSPSAGELIRILVNHPDVNLAWVHSDRLSGRPVSGYHPGLLGDTFMRFTSQPDFDGIKVVFLTDTDETSPYRQEGAIPPTVKTIDLSRDVNPAFTFGIPELNRKALVRGANTASVPSAAAHTIALSLLPLAKENLLSAPIHVAATLPGADTNNAGLASAELHARVTAEAMAALLHLQQKISEPMHIAAIHTPLTRGIITVTYTDMPAGQTLADISRLYEDYYADHAFTIVSPAPVELAEVTHTNKAALYLDEADGQLTITAVSDVLLKGSAGTAVHIMNLMFGLHERVGLALKH